MRQYSTKRFRHVAIAATLGLGTMMSASAALAESGPFTKDQAEDGHTKFNNHCAQCHRPSLEGGTGPKLIGDEFKAKWAGKPVDELRTYVHTNMPMNAPGSLPEEQLDPIIAWILMKNGLPPGDKPMSKETAKEEFKK